MSSYLWFILSFLCVMLEVSVGSGGLYFIFFAFSAFVTAILVSTDIIFETWLHWIVFATLSVLSLVVFRKKILHFFSPHEGVMDRDGIIGATVEVVDTILESTLGEVELRGTRWKAKTNGLVTLKKGSRAKVVARDGLTLIIEPELEKR